MNKYLPVSACIFYSQNRKTSYKSVFSHRRLKPYTFISDLAVNCNGAASWPDKRSPACCPSASRQLKKAGRDARFGAGGILTAHSWQTWQHVVQLGISGLRNHSSLKHNCCGAAPPWTPHPGCPMACSGSGQEANFQLKEQKIKLRRKGWHASDSSAPLPQGRQEQQCDWKEGPCSQMQREGDRPHSPGAGHLELPQKGGDSTAALPGQDLLYYCPATRSCPFP